MDKTILITDILSSLNINELKIHSRLKFSRVFYSTEDAANNMILVLSNKSEYESSDNYFINTLEEGLLRIINDSIHSDDMNYTSEIIENFHSYINTITNEKYSEIIRRLNLFLNQIEIYIYNDSSDKGSDSIPLFFYFVMSSVCAVQKQNKYKVILKEKYDELIAQETEFTDSELNRIL